MDRDDQMDRGRGDSVIDRRPGEKWNGSMDRWKARLGKDTRGKDSQK